MEDSTEKAEQAPQEKQEQTENLISFADFQKVDMRVAQILEAERVEKSAKLVKLQVSLGEPLGKRQLVAGIAKHYDAEGLIGRKIVVVTNLKPAKLMGQLSEGMLLAALGENDTLELVSVGDSMPAGAKVC